MASKTNPGNYFEDFRIGQEMRHATPRTITTGDVALYTGLYGSRFAVQSSDEFARRIGFDRAPVDDFLAFHMVFGKTVPDVSWNAVANLGYAGGVCGAPVYPGDTLQTAAEVMDSTPSQSRPDRGRTTIQYRVYNQHGDEVASYRATHILRRKPS